MSTKAQNRVLGLTVAALLVTIGGELLGMRLLTTIGVASFFVAVVGLFALMTVTLIDGVSQRSKIDVYDPALAEKVSSSTPSSEH